ncbi:hypothetical protein PMAYCL1PPCAC_09907, partial [Pristionchus mayeri]
KVYYGTPDEFSIHQGFVDWVEPGSRAERGGLEYGDEIIKIEHRDVRNLEDSKILRIISDVSNSDRLRRSGSLGMIVRRNADAYRKLLAAEGRGYDKASEEANNCITNYRYACAALILIIFFYTYKADSLKKQLEESKLHNDDIIKKLADILERTSNECMLNMENILRKLTEDGRGADRKLNSEEIFRQLATKSTSDEVEKKFDDKNSEQESAEAVITSESNKSYKELGTDSDKDRVANLVF